MLYFWLTNAVHQANRASMESMDLHLGQFNQRKKKNKKQKSSEKLKKKFQSEPDLSYGAGPSTSLQNCCSNCGGAVGQNWPPNGQNSKRRTSATVSNMSLSSSSSWFIPICFEYYVCVSFFVWEIFSLSKKDYYLLLIMWYFVPIIIKYLILDYKLVWMIIIIRKQKKLMRKLLFNQLKKIANKNVYSPIIIMSCFSENMFMYWKSQKSVVI